MNKRTWVSVIGAMAFTLLPAQSFKKLWKDVDAATAADRPRTALTVVRQIADKAAADGDEGQQVKALFAERTLAGHLSPDSLDAATRRIERLAAGTQRPALRAVLHVLLGDCYAAPYRRDTLLDRRAADHYRAATADFAALAATRAAALEPAVEQGRDSRYFGHDLLHVVARQALDGFDRLGLRNEARALSARLSAHYAVSAGREALLLLALDSLAREPQTDTDRPLDRRQRFADLTALMERFADVPLAIEAYVDLTELTRRDEHDDSVKYAYALRGLERYKRSPRAAALRQALAVLTQSRIALSCPDADDADEGSARLAYPGREMKWVVRYQNLESATVRLYRLDATPEEMERSEQSLDKRVKGLRPEQELTFALPAAPPYAERTDTVRLTVDRPGRYAVELPMDRHAADYSLLTVSRLKLMTLASSASAPRFAAVDALSGAPVRGVALRAYDRDDLFHPVDTLTTDADGRATLRAAGRPVQVYAESPDGSYAQCDVYPHGKAPSQPVESRTTSVYTDRAVYRPGQQVQFGLVVYDRRGDSLRVADDAVVPVELADPNGRTVARDTLTTDAFGAAGGTLLLPDGGLTGTYRLRAGGQSQPLRVEAYKRPTFTAELLPPATAYAPGDSVTLTGRATTYTGVPVAGATVRYTIRRRDNVWLRFPYTGDAGAESTQTGTTVTDADGRYAIRLKVELPPAAQPYVQRVRRYRVSATVTASHGESAEAAATLAVSQHPAVLSASWPSTLCSEQLPRLTFYQYNANRENIVAPGEYTVFRDGRAVARGTFTTGTPFRPDTLLALPAGAYRVVSRLEGAASAALTDTTDVILFNNTDTRLSGRYPFTAHVARSERGDSAVVYLSLPPEAHVYADLCAQSGQEDHRTLRVEGGLVRYALTYRPEYGDAAAVALAYVWQGRHYTYRADVQRPTPEKRLRLSWSTFRDRLRPGQDEEWRLRVTFPDGRPARAALTATLYDRSLDRFAALRWPDALSFPRGGVNAWWQSDYDGFYLSAFRPYDYERVDALSFDRFASLTDGGRRLLPVKRMERNELRLYDSDRMAAAPATGKMVLNEMSVMAKVADTDVKASGTTDDALPADELRTDFAETAYFTPSLLTDADGYATIAFRLPQSLTSWCFTALAHTAAMDLGRTDTTVVATKDFTVTPNLPRFLRHGDLTAVPITVRNLSGQADAGTVRFTLTDAATGRTLVDTRRPFSLAADSSLTLRFDCRATEDTPLLVCQITATGRHFGDGERHYLPVLSDKALLTRAHPFTAEGRGRTAVDLTDVLPATLGTPVDSCVVVEVTTRPEWAAVAALPALAKTDPGDAFSLARAYYALSMGYHLATRNPQVGEALGRWREAGDRAVDQSSPLGRNADLAQLLPEETPWAAEAREETENLRRLTQLMDTALTAYERYSALDRLRALQNTDGSWSWFPGMKGNESVTLDVAMALARLQDLTDDHTAAAALERACTYLDARAAERVERLRKEKDPRIDAFSVRYLYITGVTGRQPKDAAGRAADYLRQLLRQPNAALSLTDKALAAAALSLAGERDAARQRLESLMEYTVSIPGMGLTFETGRGSHGVRPGRSYGDADVLPAQAAAIETALRIAPGEMRQTIDSLRRWLVASRHTVRWDDPRSAADAVYALFCQSPLSSRRLYLSPNDTRPTLRLTAPAGRGNISVAEAVDTLRLPGYVRTTFRIGRGKVLPTRLLVERTDSGFAYGAAYARYAIPAADVRAHCTGLSLDRQLEVWRDGQWQPVDGRRVETGERLRTRFTLTADRDYDFVCLKATHAAGIEPSDALSGYTWLDGLGGYRARYDASTRYFFDHVGKGTHTVTDEFVVDRPGTYSCGVADVQCLYAPEYGGNTDEDMLLCR